MYVRVPGYLTQKRNIPNVSEVDRDFQMQSLAALVGEWNVSLNIAGVVLGETQFVFNEGGLQWFSQLGFLGDVDFSFDGSRVDINNSLTIGGDIIAGDMNAALQLDGSGRLTGNINFTHFLFGGNDCAFGCGGTLVAERVE